MSKRMKFVRAKEPMVATPIVEKGKLEKKPKVVSQRVLTKPLNPVAAKFKVKGKSSEVTKRTTNSTLFPPLWNPRTH